MSTVFDATNNIEAHMIVHLLERSGIPAEILGEHLQGGIGDLPAAGNIRVTVDHNDEAQARQIISDWEADENTKSTAIETAKAKREYGSLIGFIFGVAVSAAFFMWAYNSPTTSTTADWNRDGITDETHFWAGDYVSRIDGDRNSDGRVDIRFHYSRGGGQERIEADDDFNGSFELQTYFKHSKLDFEELDTSGNGKPDRRYHYRDGVLVRVVMFRDTTGVPRKSQTYENGLLKEARWDSDRDGILDTLIKYGEFEEELSSSKISNSEN